MVNVGILGADTPLAGETIRILINHPEVELSSLFAPSMLGRNASSVHHGLIGENPLSFTDKLNLEAIDFLAIMEPTEIAQNIIDKIQNIENLKLVFFENDFTFDKLEEKFEIALSEINRKALVRGARVAYIPSPVIVPSLVALMPLAHYLLLNSDIEIEVKTPSDIFEKFDEKQESEYIEKLLKEKQASFNGRVNLKIIEDIHSERTEITKISLSCPLPIAEIENLYDQLYDDHNFTFLTRNEISASEVEGTQKIIINLKKEEPDKLEIETVSDARLRGGAGDIIHVMNLFFGLHEKTGLNLKTSRF